MEVLVQRTHTGVFSAGKRDQQSIMIINCPNDGNVASMPELCHRYLLLLEGREGGVLHCSGL